MPETTYCEGDDEIVSLYDRIVGRCASEDVRNPLDPDEILVGHGELISELVAKKIEDVGVERVKILSPLTHLKKNSITAKAYYVADFASSFSLDGLDTEFQDYAAYKLFPENG